MRCSRCVDWAVIAFVRNRAPAVNIPAGLLTGYLVITGLTTVRRPAASPRWLDVGGMAVALAVGLASLTFGFEAVASGGRRNGIPAFPFFMFGVVGVLASAGDFLVGQALRERLGLQGISARHSRCSSRRCRSSSDRRK
jgi:hypothetical protein